jgi:hypothetical protein
MLERNNLMIPRNTAAASEEPTVLGGGQFIMRYGKKCADCGDFIGKGEVAGYNDLDEIVCEGCWVPWSDR